MKKLKTKNVKHIEVFKRDLFEMFLDGLYAGAGVEDFDGFSESELKDFEKLDFTPPYKKLLIEKLKIKNAKKINVSKRDLFEMFREGLYASAAWKNVEYAKSLMEDFEKSDFEPVYKKLFEKNKNKK